MKVYLGADHGGYELKNLVYEHLVHKGYQVEDLGAPTLDLADDFPQYAYAVVTKILGEEGDSRGLLFCKRGNGMAMAANRVGGIRAAVGWDMESVMESREDNDANVLCVPTLMLDQQSAFDIIDKWLETKFSAEERYMRRNKQIDELYG
jgi:ribose 5-phosphate isomerase B